MVGKAHGLDGSVYVVQANAALLVKGAQVFLDGEDEPRTITRRAGTVERPILRLSGAENRNDSDALRGRRLSVSITDAPALEDDEYWAHQLVGCSVTGQVAGEALGDVLELLAYPSCELLRVGGGARGELLVPLVKDAIVEIDVEARRILVDDEFLALDD
ncbi:MAG: ribosome maturation factor RimM [Patulibacter minatonensis]